MDKSLARLLPVALLSGLCCVASAAPAALPTQSPSNRTLLTSQTQLAYCQWRRVCSTRCVERAGRYGGGYCIRWDYLCTNVCDGGYGPYYYHHWRRGFWW